MYTHMQAEREDQSVAVAGFAESLTQRNDSNEKRRPPRSSCCIPIDPRTHQDMRSSSPSHSSSCMPTNALMHTSLHSPIHRLMRPIRTECFRSFSCHHSLPHSLTHSLTECISDLSIRRRTALADGLALGLAAWTCHPSVAFETSSSFLFCLSKHHPFIQPSFMVLSQSFLSRVEKKASRQAGT